MPRDDCTLATDTQLWEQTVGDVGDDFPCVGGLAGLHHDSRSQAALETCLQAQRRARL